MSLGHVLFGFRGRISRAKYWLAIVLWTAVLAAGQIVPSMVAGMSFDELLDIALAFDMFRPILALGLIFLIVWAISFLAVGVKRLHDRDKSGWWAVLFFVPLTLDVVAVFAHSIELIYLSNIASAFIIIWCFVELGVLRGTQGNNRFGADPLEIAA